MENALCWPWERAWFRVYRIPLHGERRRLPRGRGGLTEGAVEEVRELCMHGLGSGKLPGHLPSASKSSNYFVELAYLSFSSYWYSVVGEIRLKHVVQFSTVILVAQRKHTFLVTSVVFDAEVLNGLGNPYHHQIPLFVICKCTHAVQGSARLRLTSQS